ncbi:MAG: hypothetical protein KatS3mg105_1646 [Gemmatales bacterium]|nr:MAG: hypothetical protein KatS3mg105_1646 [Gemmatales bacterium]
MRLRISFSVSLTLAATLMPVTAHGADPTEQLRQILATHIDSPIHRQVELSAVVGSLHKIDDLRKALELEEWLDNGVDERLAAVDRQQRSILADRFVAYVRHQLARGDDATRLALLDMLGSMGRTVRDGRRPQPLTWRFSSDLATSIAAGPEHISLAATRALKNIQPEPQSVAPALRKALKNGSPAVRSAVADVLVYWMDTEGRRFRSHASATKSPVRAEDVIQLAQSVAQTAEVGLQDRETHIRQLSLLAIERAAAAVRMIAPPARTDAGEIIQLPSGIAPFLSILRNLGNALSPSLTDESVEVRLRALQTLEELAQTHLQWGRTLQRSGLLQPPDHPLGTGFESILQVLGCALCDKDVRIRRRAVGVLETFGPAAIPAVQVLVKALEDQDLFVRWSAARTLGKMGEQAANQATPALIQRFDDAAVEVRLAAILAVHDLGPAASQAVPALLQKTLARQARVRAAALQALQSFPSEADSILECAVAALDDPDPDVRIEAARLLGTFGPRARDALSALERALSDESPHVRHEIHQALIAIQR